MEYSCIDCSLNGCRKPDGKHPKFCLANDFELESEAWLTERLADAENRRIIESAAASAGKASDNKLSRLEESIEFAKGLKVKKIGIAACACLAAEARAAAKVYRAHGFEVIGTICKIGTITHADLDLHVGRKPQSVLCNPIYQAKVLNDEKTDLNVIIGLCIGHDSLFMKYSEALCTVLTIKDFKFDHYSARALRPNDDSGEYQRLSGEK